MNKPPIVIDLRHEAAPEQQICWYLFNQLCESIVNNRKLSNTVRFIAPKDVEYTLQRALAEAQEGR